MGTRSSNDRPGPGPDLSHWSLRPRRLFAAGNNEGGMLREEAGRSVGSSEEGGTYMDGFKYLYYPLVN